MVSAQIYAGLPKTLQKPIINKIQMLDPENIINIVSQQLNISVSDIKSRSRKRHIVDARCICINLILKTNRYTLKQIGNLFNGKHHATIIYSKDQYDCLYTRDKDFTDKVNKLKDILLIAI